MHLSDEEVQQFAEAERREVDPPIQVERATWSKAGLSKPSDRTAALDGWVSRCWRCQAWQGAQIKRLVSTAADPSVSTGFGRA